MKKQLGILYIIVIFAIALLMLVDEKIISDKIIIMIVMFILIINFSIFIYTCIFLIQKQKNLFIKKILFSWYFVLWFLINGISYYSRNWLEGSLILTSPFLVLMILLFFKKIQNNNNLN